MKFGTLIVVLCSAVVLHGAETRQWAFETIRRPNPPTLPNASQLERCDNPIDSFILKKLDEAGLSPSPEAPPGVLLRRLHFVLAGLPPSPEDIAAFERNPNYEFWVERLLNSPAYGERWARHWLDVVRFAETHGFEMNQPRNTAWRYRDYVIRAFNSDKPYNQFIREQIAGDLYGEDDATGFLVSGPWDQVKSPDLVLTKNQRADELHDIVSTAGSALMGLTIGCARCHDHKFDPIPQADYFAIKAVFAGVEHGDRARGDVEAQLTRKKISQLKEQVARIEGSLEELEGLSRPDLTNALRRPVNARRNVERFSPVPAQRLRFTISKTTDAEPCLDELEVYSSGGTNVALASFGTRASASGTYPNSEIHRLEHLNDGKTGNSRSWISNEPGKGWVTLQFPEPVTISKVIWGRDREERFRDRLALDYEIAVASDQGEWRPIASSSDRQTEKAEWVADEKTSGLLSERKAVLEEMATLDSDLSVYAGKFKSKPELTHRLHRGDPMLEREIVEPAALRSVKVDFRPECGDTAHTEDQIRRSAFAEWLVHPSNSLPARVMVNRIWQYHFGEGLVSTPSDFGANGARPTHPELLDWLASEFMETGWSVKRLQRLIVTSATFRQASVARPDTLALDANSRMLWRFPPRRLEAESIRDTILSVSGKLNGKMGGSGFNFFEANDNYVRVYAPRNEWPEATFRRMVYGTVVRQRPDGVFGVFDCPDGGQIAPKRTSSTTPLQALNLLNSSFIMQQADFFAQRLEQEYGHDTGRQIDRAIALAFQRPATTQEIEAANRFVAAEGLPLFCRALLNANEFIYLF